MPHMSDAQKLARVLGNAMDSMSVDYHMIVAHFSNRDTGVQLNMFELILAFLNKYASLYAHGNIEPGDRAYRMCKMSHQMICALDTPEWDDLGTGRHCADEDA